MGRKHWIRDTIYNVVFSVPTGVQSYEGKKKYFSTGSIQDTGNCEEGEFCFQEKPSRANRIAQLNDVLQARMKNTNKPILIDKNLEGNLFSTGFIQLRPFADTYNSKFLYYYIQSSDFLSQKDNLATGSTQEALTDTNAGNLEFPIPPLNEQKRISKKLDAIIPKVKRAKLRLDKIPGILKKFRQSVLAAACSGRLTENWREGKDLPDWEETTIRKIAISMSTGPFGTMLHSYDYIKYGIPVINPTNICADKIIPDNSITLKQEKADQLSHYRLQINDILLARRGDLSKCGIVTEQEVNWIAGTGLFILRAKINPTFFKYLFSTDIIQSKLNNNSIGSTMPNLNQIIMGDIELLLPSLEEQHEIVRRVKKLFALADTHEAKIKKAMERVEKIEQAVLAKAFCGDLVEPDPNDEPSEELLKMILEEKIKLESGKKKRKKIGQR
jgi:type I restriction enzyme S subunit